MIEILFIWLLPIFKESSIDNALAVYNRATVNLLIKTVLDYRYFIIFLTLGKKWMQKVR